MIRVLWFAASLAAAGCAATPKYEVVVDVECTAQADGSLTDCRALSSTSADPGFADAAVRAAMKGKVVLEAQPPQTVRFRMKFWEHPDSGIAPV
ncbi:hypothetical protein ACIQC9_02885 [Brevundimonas sp. NPDC092305]|uniref:hypothetical protein n=1 Tax=Brevundimonas sp. NPDC092305 TaxID=3363957 RepID=UPI00382391C7